MTRGKICVTSGVDSGLGEDRGQSRRPGEHEGPSRGLGGTRRRPERRRRRDEEDDREAGDGVQVPLPLHE